MNISLPAKPLYPVPDAGRSAADGIREAMRRFERNVAEVARGEDSQSQAPGSRDYALVEQQEIVRAVRANAKSLQTANQTLGTILDIKV